MSIAPGAQIESLPEFRWEPAALASVGWRQKHWIVLGLLVGIGAGVACGILLPRVYQSSAQISFLKKRPDSVTGVDTRQLSADDYLAPPQEVLRSSLIIDGAIRAKGLAALPIFDEGEKDLAEKIRNSLTVTPSKGPPGQMVVYKLAYRSRDIEASQAVLSAILDSFQDFIDKRHNSISVDSIDLIVREKQALQKSLEEKEAAYRAFRETAPLPGSGKDGLELRQERLNSIQTKRSNLLLQRLELEGQLAALETALKEGRNAEATLALLAEFARKGDGSADAGRERPISLQDQLLPLLQEERRLLQVNGAKHPEVLAIQDRIESTRRLLLLPPTSWKRESSDGSAPPVHSVHDAVSLHMQLLRQKLDHVKISEELLAKVFQTEQEDARRLNAYEIQNESFRTSIHLNQQLYEALAKRLTEASLLKNVGGYQIEMIDPPSPGKRVAPSMAITLLVGAFLGTLVGCLLALAANHRAMSVRTAPSEC